MSKNQALLIISIIAIIAAGILLVWAAFMLQ